MEAFIDGRDFLFKNNADQLLLRSRIAVSSFTLILALLVFFVGKEMFDTQTGLLALSLLVLDPNLLAHAALVTTDAAITCLVFASVYAWRRHTLQPSVWGLLLTAVLVGLAFATKFTGLFLAPILILLAITEALQQRSLRLLTDRGVALSMIFCGAYTVLWSCYGFRYAAVPADLFKIQLWQVIYGSTLRWEIQGLCKHSPDGTLFPKPFFGDSRTQSSLKNAT